MDLRYDPIPPLIRKLAFPASLGMLFTTLLNVVDTWYAGTLSATALAALSLSGPIFFLVMTIGIGVGQASNALVGNRLGANDPVAARRLALQTIIFATLLASIGAFSAYLGAPWLFRMMGAEEPYLLPAIAYMNVVLLGSAFFSVSIVISSILNTRGDTFSYRNAQLIALVANVGLDPLFMYVFNLGVVGIAVATILIQAGVVIWLLYKVFQLNFMRHPRLSEWLPQPASFGEIARQSIPSSASMLLVAIGSLIIVAFVAPFGEASVAAYGIALRVEQLFLLLVIGINIAAISITSVNFGAGQIPRVAETYLVGLRYALTLTLFGGVMLLLFAGQLMSVFTDDEEVRSIGVTYLWFEAFILPAYALTFLSSAVLQGLKRPEIVLYFNIGRQIIGQLLLFWLAVHVFGSDIRGVWWSVLIINWVLAAGIVRVVRKLLAGLAEHSLSKSPGSDDVALSRCSAR